MDKGIYDKLLSRRLAESIKRLQQAGLMASLLEEVDQAERAGVLSDAFEDVLRKSLAIANDGEVGEQQVRFYNSLLEHLAELTGGSDVQLEKVELPPRQLKLVWPEDAARPRLPDSPLANGTLLTGTRQDPSLVSQLRKELDSADQVDILCSFIKWGGVRVLTDELRAFCDRKETTLRVITTSYLGATDFKAIEFLRELPKTQIRVSYDTHRTRLHAKAYIIRRKTGFGSAYIGSANLSQAALTDGLEWTVKVSQYEQSYLWDKAVATFETYWSDAEFEPYGAGDRARLDAALKSERGGDTDDGRGVVYFDLRPYAFQLEILEKIQANRDLHGRNRHLVVAATGTGKTMIAAFDYRKWTNIVGDGLGRPRLLFIAHREEILRQSLGVFRAVLRDHNFGDLFVGGIEPTQLDHLFVSIQSYNSRELWRLASDHYDYVVVDEFHHAAAASYRRLLGHVSPKVLLGLTATPERADGFDVRSYFGGHVAAEIRLADAINRKLLSPFQYFGVSDSEDLSGLRWSRGGYRADDLDRVFTGNDVRAQLVLQKVIEKVLDIKECRGLGFCVSVKHAEFMARRFQDAGIPAEALSADSNNEHRRTVQDRLRRREINFIFVVDLYNEGVDIPEVDTILLLRPTESLTVFLQQFGRGLRLCEDKECLAVMDFIGQAHESYRFDLRFKALMSDSTRNVVDEIENGFAHLPAGCSIQFERKAREYVLENIKRAIRRGVNVLIDGIRDLTTILGRRPGLGEFMEHHGLELDDIYRRGNSWSRLCVEAGVRQAWSSAYEERITKGFRRLEHINSRSQIQALLKVLDGTRASDADEMNGRLLLMSHFSIWGKESKLSIADGISRILASAVLREELVEMLKFRLEQSEFTTIPMTLPFKCPLETHGAYTRDELLAGLGHWTIENQPELREGVIHLSKIRADAFLFTLHKSEKDYSPTTMYQDYAINERLVHWQSQNTTSVDSATGRRYLTHQETGHTILLFAREFKEKAGLSSPYYFLGPAEYLSHEGSKPISFTWRLMNELPAKLYRRMVRLAVG